MTFLSLAAAVASIGGASELYVRTGSTISLTCSLRGSSAAAAAAALTPRTPFWFHDGRPVALDSPRGGISLETERTTAGMTSKLLLTKASHQDGTSCWVATPPALPPHDGAVLAPHQAAPTWLERSSSHLSVGVVTPPTCAVTHGSLPVQVC